MVFLLVKDFICESWLILMAQSFSPSGLERRQGLKGSLGDAREMLVRPAKVHGKPGRRMHRFQGSERLHQGIIALTSAGICGTLRKNLLDSPRRGAGLAPLVLAEVLFLIHNRAGPGARINDHLPSVIHGASRRLVCSLLSQAPSRRLGRAPRTGLFWPLIAQPHPAR
jgi:hypothetical protein